MDQELNLPLQLATVILADQPELPTKEEIRQVAERIVQVITPSFEPRIAELIRELESRYIIRSNQKTRMIDDAEYLQRVGYRHVGKLLIAIMFRGVSYVNPVANEQGLRDPLAFLPFDSLELDTNPDIPGELIAEIEAHAAAIIARRGERFDLLAGG